jgi:hypothetical protein
MSLRFPTASPTNIAIHVESCHRWTLKYAYSLANRVMKAQKVGKGQSYRLTQTGIEEVQGWLKAPKENAE